MTNETHGIVLMLGMAACAPAPPPPAPPPAEPAAVVVVERPGPEARFDENEPTEPAPARDDAGAAPAEPRARDREEARQLFAEGAEAYRQGDYAKARERWEAARALVDKPALLFNLVQAAQRQGDAAGACRYAEELRRSADADMQQALARLQLSCPP